jgi:hypothetical protein
MNDADKNVIYSLDRLILTIHCLDLLVQQRPY